VKPVSLVPSALRRIIEYADAQLYVENSPPRRILPSLCIAIDSTALSSQWLTKLVSLVPSALRRIISFAAVQLYVVNCPPTKILPSLCTARANTELLNQLQLVNPVSFVPSVLRRIILIADAQLYVVNVVPPTMILPSLCIARVWTAPLNQPQILRPVSLVPSALRRIISFAVAQLYVENCPPAMILPSLCIDRE
jgi:hypothetical protein